MGHELTLKTQIENIVSVMGTINDEWTRDANESCTKKEFEDLYNDISEVLTRVEDMELAISVLTKAMGK